MDNTLTSLSQQLHQLRGAHASGALAADAYEEQRIVLERAIVDAVLAAPPPDVDAGAASLRDLEAAPSDVEIGPSKLAAAAESPWLFAAMAGAVVLIAGSALWWTGAATPSTSSPSASPATAMAGAMAGAASSATPVGNAAAHDTGNEQMVAMVERLALRLKTQPDDAQGWAMLARSYSVLGRRTEALAAFEHALSLSKDDAVLQADYASALAQQKPLAGAPSATATATGRAVAAAAAPGTVSGSVTLASALAQQVAPDDTVFVFARAASGERTPLAVLRKQVKDLPLQFTLDDSMGMSPQNKLSGAAQVIVSARVSKSGQAMAQSGDMLGQAAPVSVGTSGIAIEIRERVK